LIAEVIRPGDNLQAFGSKGGIWMRRLFDPLNLNDDVAKGASMSLRVTITAFCGVRRGGVGLTTNEFQTHDENLRR
jgi:hypothetical protein